MTYTPLPSPSPSARVTDFAEPVSYGITAFICSSGAAGTVYDAGVDAVGGTGGVGLGPVWDAPAELHFKVGHIAELKWALKTCCCWSTQKSKSRIRKGSMHPVYMEGKEVLADTVVKKVVMGELFLVMLAHCLILPGGGVGGAGGEGGVQGHFGGKGEAGGRGVKLGGTGGVGGASQIPVLYIGFFNRISGGIGGPGGYADNEGGQGGVGEANIFPSLISPIDDETRRQIQPTPLEELEISTMLCERLKDHGFRTVGGLFEAYEQDVQQPGFEPGNLGDLKAVLRKVAAQYRV
ncbi:hypothetical protein B0H13DRAFT_2572426 [Mycena leptocephala]|nr:hypothetical protein B0H13DRAFT_2572426 [Mycena leptocephala]